MVLIFAREPIFGFLYMGNPFEQNEPVTTLGISATIMILYNMVGWPYILELTAKSPRFRDFSDKDKRAKAMLD